MTSILSEAGPANADPVLEHATPEQVRFYREQGYLKFGTIFTHAEMEALRARVDGMIAALPEGKRPEEMDVPHFNDPWLFRYLAHPRILDIIEDFIGPNIVLWSSHFIAKPQGDGRAVPWHTDGAYWTNRLVPMDVITLWLAVDESTVENGCMRVMPGSHKGIRASVDAYESVDKSTHVFHARIKPDMIDETQAVNLELKVGECHFHDAWTIHGSNPNHSTRRRTGYTMRYMPANAVFRNDGRNREHRIYLLRGEDQTGGQNEYTPLPEWS
ncbi:MAG TPA: phytanoyl-CoA dioxygenase family protein [Chthonomonadaceae bacterium]|nr:phytanoyl-CoA dioxygenase family protein [Chthonomonadaceae bacterium]